MRSPCPGVNGEVKDRGRTYAAFAFAVGDARAPEAAAPAFRAVAHVSIVLGAHGWHCVRYR